MRLDACEILWAAVRHIDPTDLTDLTDYTDSGALDRRVHLVAAGKAAWPMARAACLALGHRVTRAIGTGPRGPGVMPAVVEWFEGAHPLPDEDSVRAGIAALDLAASARRTGETLLVLLSGGGSSMLAAPPPGVPLRDKRAVIEALLRSGADITQVNCVRRHLSTIKGGRLAATAGRSLTLAISDVHAPEDDPSTIASGPTAADESTAAQTIDVLERLRVAVPGSVRAHLDAVRGGREPETLKPGDPRLDGASFVVIANRRLAMAGAGAAARAKGYAVLVVDAAIRGEAREAGRRFAEEALEAAPASARVCVIASGETTVTVTGSGKGGRNQEFALGAAPVLSRSPQPTVVASAGTDGIDGPTDAAGAVVSSATVARCEAIGIDIGDTLARNDAYPALARLGALIKWGPTLTNVGDVHVLLTMRP